MDSATLAELNQQFAIPGRVSFAAGPGGLPVANVVQADATATISLYGAHVLSFQPRGDAPVLWTSRAARYERGTAIRGGIPVCWPWFGPHPSDPGMPAHGFARTTMWNVLGCAAADDTSELRLSLVDTPATRELWPHTFHIQLTVLVGQTLEVRLIVSNPSSEAWSFTGALHSYFAVGAIDAVTIHGLDGCTYIDQLQHNARVKQRGPITIEQEVDRIYLDTADTCAIEDRAMQRRITVAKTGSRSTVVWNPWIEKAARMPDFGDDEFREMVCVETANAADDRVLLQPGATHRTTVTIGAENL